MDMFSEDGSITDSGRGGSEQGEHVSTSIRPLPPADTALVPASHLSDLAESGEDLPLPPPPTEYRSMETQSTCLRILLPRSTILSNVLIYYYSNHLGLL
jgi:hypothetical protein